MDNFSTVISHKIRKVREIKGFSQEYIAGKLNLSQNAYSRIERGEIHISQEKLIQIASALEVDVEIIKNYSDSTIFNNCTNSVILIIIYFQKIMKKLKRITKV